MKTKTTPIRKITKLVRKNPLNYWYYRSFKSSESFQLDGRDYRYFYHPHNTTWLNERAVELPIIWDYVHRNRGQRILEVGNVLSHYYSTCHTIVDKYEKADGVTNEDIVDHSPMLNYDLIVGISTLEHVGWDEHPREPNKIPCAIENLRRLLNPSGQIVLTMPLGYNVYLDRMIEQGRLNFDRQWFLKRVSSDNRWQQVGWEDVRGAAYNSPYFYANALVIGFIQRQSCVDVETTSHRAF